MGDGKLGWGGGFPNGKILRGAEIGRGGTPLEPDEEGDGIGLGRGGPVGCMFDGWGGGRVRIAVGVQSNVAFLIPEWRSSSRANRIPENQACDDGPGIRETKTKLD